MRRGHRRWHRTLWLLLGPLAVVLVALAWTSRQPIPAQAPLELDAALEGPKDGPEEVGVER